MKRFWREVTLADRDGGWQVLLDGRPIRTPRAAPQWVPGRALAEALADEWRGQGETVDPAGFALRDLADYAIDIVVPDREGAIGKLLGFAETDTLCYRADPDEPIARRQRERWEPLLKRLEAAHAVRFERISGIIHRPQPPATLAALRRLLEGLDDFTLSALAAAASLAASLTVALAALEPDADAADLWAAANLEEDWQVEQWGEDAEAMDRRARRFAAFAAAVRFAGLTRGGGEAT